MPQTMYPLMCDSFVNPAQLCSPLPIVYECEMGGQDQMAQLSLEVGSPTHMIDTSFGWSSSPSESSKSGHGQWTRQNSFDGSYTSPPSSAPSPGSIVGQNQKRRAQNRAAQRAYRDRKMRYLVDLESGIRGIEHKIKHLQTENTDLIRELCEMRAANNDLKNNKNNTLKEATQLSKSSKGKLPEDPLLQQRQQQQQQQQASQRLQAARASLDPHASLDPGAAAAETDTLYEPFAAMWNLIRLDPSVVKGEVSPQTVLEQLRSMVELGRRRPDMRTSQSYPNAASFGWPAGGFGTMGGEQRISVA